MALLKHKAVSEQYSNLTEHAGEQALRKSEKQSWSVWIGLGN